MVTESNLPTPTHFAEQVLCFHKSFCELLLKHELCKSKLVRGFSVFDEAVLRYGEEVDYTHESEILCDYFIRQKWISSVTKPLILSEYRSFVEKFRSHEVSYEGDWVTFLANYYELHCRQNLFTIFKLCCLSSSGVIVPPPNFILSVPELASDVILTLQCAVFSHLLWGFQMLLNYLQTPGPCLRSFPCLGENMFYLKMNICQSGM